MPIPSKYLAEFNENGIYHIYNRTNNREVLFLSPENYLFFLRKYGDHLHGVLDTFCWCLLPNHFHLLVHIKTEQDIYRYLESKEYRLQTPSEKLFLDKKLFLGELIERAFKQFFQSYSMALISNLTGVETFFISHSNVSKLIRIRNLLRQLFIFMLTL